VEDRTDPPQAGDAVGPVAVRLLPRRAGQALCIERGVGPAAHKAGFPPRTGLHCWRHLLASALIRYGESPRTVQHLLGHNSPAITQNVYAHLWRLRPRSLMCPQSARRPGESSVRPVQRKGLGQ
jgi:integrase